ncbi:MAG: outer membrane protein assembly factor BamE [Burkholderiales bacterium]|nr:outer membrane protein assembly factor BamE [Burkholderiales bacterium]
MADLPGRKMVWPYDIGFSVAATKIHLLMTQVSALVALRALALAAAFAALAGCGTRDPNRSGLFEPYRTDLPQGNYLTRQQVDQVKEGMTREQVRFALGSPLLMHVFHPDRWDYVFRYQFPNGNTELRRVTLRFANDRVAAIEADELPLKEDANDPALPGYRPSAKTAGKP